MSTDFVYRVALIVPDAVVDAARRIAAAMGWGEGCYSVALAPSENGPATHWGLSASARQSFIDMLQAAGDGTPLPDIDPADLAAVMPVLEMSVGPASASPVVQFSALCDSLGLKRVVEAVE